MSDDRTGRRRVRKAARPAGSGLKIGLASVLVGLGCLGLAALIVIRAVGVSPQVLLSEAATDLERASLEDLPEISQRARSALDADPLEARALSLLAVVAEREDQADKATALMRVASRMSRRDTSVDAWLYTKGLRAQRYSEAFTHADAIMRRRRETLPALFPELLATLGDQAAIRPMAERLVYRPEWRRDFIEFVVERSPSRAFDLLDTARKMGSPPTEHELSTYLRRMVVDERFTEAQAHWQLLRGPGGGATGAVVTDGEFAGLRPVAPFGWNFEGNVVGNIDRANSYGRDETALRIDYDGMSEARFPEQLIVLAPGRYRLAMDALTVTPDSAGTLEWTVACAEGGFVARLPVADTAVTWKRFAIDFDVPAQGCGAQWLGVRAIRSDKRSNVQVWYDKVTVSRAPGGPA